MLHPLSGRFIFGKYYRGEQGTGGGEAGGRRGGGGQTDFPKVFLGLRWGNVFFDVI